MTGTPKEFAEFEESEFIKKFRKETQKRLKKVNSAIAAHKRACNRAWARSQALIIKTGRGR